MKDKSGTREADKSLKSLKWSKLMSRQKSLIVECELNFIMSVN